MHLKARGGSRAKKNDFSSNLDILESYLSSFQNGVIFLPTRSGFHFTDREVRHGNQKLLKNGTFLLSSASFFSTLKGKIEKV